MRIWIIWIRPIAAAGDSGDAERLTRNDGPEIVVPHGVEDLVQWMGFERGAHAATGGRGQVERAGAESDDDALPALGSADVYATRIVAMAGT